MSALRYYSTWPNRDDFALSALRVDARIRKVLYLLARIIIDARGEYRGAKGDHRAISTVDFVKLIIFSHEISDKRESFLACIHYLILDWGYFKLLNHFVKFSHGGYLRSLDALGATRSNTYKGIKEAALVFEAQNRVPTLLNQIRTKLNLSVSFLLLRSSTKRSGKESTTRSTRSAEERWTSVKQVER